VWLELPAETEARECLAVPVTPELEATPVRLEMLELLELLELKEKQADPCLGPLDEMVLRERTGGQAILDVLEAVELREQQVLLVEKEIPVLPEPLEPVLLGTPVVQETPAPLELKETPVSPAQTVTPALTGVLEQQAHPVPPADRVRKETVETQEVQETLGAQGPLEVPDLEEVLAAREAEELQAALGQLETLGVTEVRALRESVGRLGTRDEMEALDLLDPLVREGATEHQDGPPLERQEHPVSQEVVERLVLVVPQGRRELVGSRECLESLDLRWQFLKDLVDLLDKPVRLVSLVKLHKTSSSIPTSSLSTPRRTRRRSVSLA